MRSSLAKPVLFLLTIFTSQSTALQAISSSPCAVQCGNVLGQTTGEDDISCYDDDFRTTSKARVFENCITCQLGSKYVDPVSKQTDLQWALYNLRYAVSWCLYGFPNNTKVEGTPCYTSTACGSLENAFEFDSLSPNATAYGYCGLMSEEAVPRCTACLSHSDEFFITNYVTALSAACIQQPIPGTTISISGNLFSNIRTNITDPSLASDLPASQLQHPSVSLGARLGIAVAVIIAILITAGCLIVCFGKRRRRAILLKKQRSSGFSEWQDRVYPSSSTPFETNISASSTQNNNDSSSQQQVQQTPFYDSPDRHSPGPESRPPWAMKPITEIESPVITTGEKVYFSPYSSQYTSPVSATEALIANGSEWPRDDKFLPLRRAASQNLDHGWARDRKDTHIADCRTEGIEMQNVPPVLMHPGNGRVGSNAVLRGDLM